MHQWKLAELRSRTDRDLMRAWRRDIERGLALASVASNTASPLYARAQEAYRRALKVAPFLPHGAVRVSPGLAELRSALDAVTKATVLCAGG